MNDPQKKAENLKEKDQGSFFALLRPFAGFLRFLVILLFFGALFWAKAQDPFTRKWFTLKTSEHGSFKCVAVLPKSARTCPVLIYVHGSGGTLMNDGNDLRQMAELGLAVVSLEYNQTNASTFGPQVEALLRYIGRQKWADSNSIAWVGNSMGAIRAFEYLREHPDLRPQLFVLWSGPGLSEVRTNDQLRSLRCPILLIHGEEDDRFPIEDTKRLASLLHSNGLPVDLKIVPTVGHGWGSERASAARSIGEYCLAHLAGKDAWQNYHSIAQWQAEAPPLWLFWLPAAAWALGWIVFWRRRKAIFYEKAELTSGDVALRCVAVSLAVWALAETSLHLVTPRLAVGERTLSIARLILVQPKEHGDFEFLAAQPIWRQEKLASLLDHVELAGYNRELINWQLDDKVYRDYVLSPAITGDSGEQLNWRRSLWEEFYPRIRHESLPEEAAKIVVRHLRERVTIATLSNPPRNVPEIWLRQITDATGFENIYVAALRSVGVPGRLNAGRQTEFWDGNDWRAAPRPLLEAW